MYQSMKQSIAQYNKIQKKKETNAQKSLFRWKLITLGLAVLVILFAGFLSQIYKDIDKNKINKYNTSFLPLLLSQSQKLQTTNKIKNLLYGLNTTTQVKFLNATRLFGDSNFSANAIRDAVKGHENLLYLFSVDKVTMFGLFLQKEFPEDWNQQKNNQTGQVFIIQPKNNKAAVLFNIMQNQSFKLDLKDQCFTYMYKSKQPQSFSLFQFIRIDAVGSLNQIYMRIQDGKFNCFGNSLDYAASLLSNMTGVQINPNEQIDVQIQRLEIFKLSFDLEKQKQK